MSRRRKSLRVLHAAAGLFAGIALYATIYGPVRVAVACLVLAIAAQLVSIDRLRFAQQTGSKNP
ncbi:hypothetical protein SAMN05192583_1018 [Sphingomonas gellani]|uniref:Uncharacterized protein n=1 Tax=Sphingomonas gellani TaxID=1166340 RepID=A0A1H8ASM5_9SPHN|nr:hypothetical protein [Sphingomonas gellani]SEM72964.1 hypothetical protein SAMN05192583_1018 [Sphingomonas gellani]